MANAPIQRDQVAFDQLNGPVGYRQLDTPGQAVNRDGSFGPVLVQGGASVNCRENGV
jgi:hypothetical protein